MVLPCTLVQDWSPSLYLPYWRFLDSSTSRHGGRRLPILGRKVRVPRSGRGRLVVTGVPWLPVSPGECKKLVSQGDNRGNRSGLGGPHGPLCTREREQNEIPSPLTAPSPLSSLGVTRNRFDPTDLCSTVGHSTSLVGESAGSQTDYYFYPDERGGGREGGGGRWGPERVRNRGKRESPGDRGCGWIRLRPRNVSVCTRTNVHVCVCVCVSDCLYRRPVTLLPPCITPVTQWESWRSRSGMGSSSGTPVSFFPSLRGSSDSSDPMGILLFHRNPGIVGYKFLGTRKRFPTKYVPVVRKGCRDGPTRQ